MVKLHYGRENIPILLTNPRLEQDPLHLHLCNELIGAIENLNWDREARLALRRNLGACGVLLGAVVTIYANEAPKALTPLLRMRCDPVAEQAMRRFTGWSLALGGIGYAGAWLFAPIGSASTIAICLLGASMVLVVARFVWGGTSKQSRA